MGKCGGRLQFHVCVLEKRQPHASWKPRRFCNNTMYSISVLVLVCLFFCFSLSALGMFDNNVSEWCLCFSFPLTRNQYCACEVTGATLEMFLMPEKIHVQMLKLLVFSLFYFIFYILLLLFFNVLCVERSLVTLKWKILFSALSDYWL